MAKKFDFGHNSTQIYTILDTVLAVFSIEAGW